MKLKMNDLTKTMCNRERKFPFQMEEGKTFRYERAAACKGVLHDLIMNRIKKEEVSEKLTEAFANVDVKSEEQRAIQAADMERYILRYVKSETRPVTELPSKDIDVYKDIIVNVTPDFAFFSTEESGKQVIEVVKVRLGKPDKKKDMLGLYCLLKYAELLVTTGKDAIVKGSYYFLRRSDDKNGTNPHFASDFFEKGGGNVVSIVETIDGSSTNPTKTDIAMEETWDNFLNGKESSSCTPDDCAYCKLNKICNYAEPPKQLVVEKVGTKLTNVKLTPAQDEAVHYMNGLCVINAGAGSGKTTVVALRVVNLLSSGVLPEHILLVTFTVAGAEEMRNRIAKYIDDFGLEVDITKMHICTFNAFGNEIIQKEHERLGFDNPPKVVDEIERSRIIADLLNANVIDGLNYRDFLMENQYVMGALAMTRKIFSIVKQGEYGLSDLDEVYNRIDYASRFVSKDTVAEVIKLYDKYDDVMHEECLIEFADQEVLLRQLVNEDPYYLDQFGFEHIIVDEFQDSNENQIKFLQLLGESPSFKSLMVVGDDNQAIFSFRGTTPEYIINFAKYFSGRTVDRIDLLENHRSKKEIIDFANAIAELNTRRTIKTLVPARESGNPVVVRGFMDRKEEYTFLANKIKEAIDAGTKPEEIAFIAPKNDQLLKMAGLLNERGVQAIMLNPEALLDNSRVQAVISFFKFMKNPEDTKDAVTFINASMGGGVLDMDETELKTEVENLQKQIEALKVLEKDEKKARLEEIFRSIDLNDDEIYQSFLEGLMMKNIDVMADYVMDFDTFGEKEKRRRNHSYAGVVLTTAHSSKGLEWPIVFNSVTGYDSEALHAGSRVKTLDAVEEKRRLLFVSCTRARDELYVTGVYTAFGNAKNGYTYNMFLKECFDITGQVMDATTIEAQRILKKQQKKEEKKKK